MAKRRGRARLGRRIAAVFSVAALGAGMLTAVDRGDEGRRHSARIERLEAEADAARSRVAEAMRRVDSLTSRERIGREARALGLRPASDEEITFLRDAGAEPDEDAGEP